MMLRKLSDLLSLFQSPEKQTQDTHSQALPLFSVPPPSFLCPVFLPPSCSTSPYLSLSLVLCLPCVSVLPSCSQNAHLSLSLIHISLPLSLSLFPPNQLSPCTSFFSALVPPPPTLSLLSLCLFPLVISFSLCNNSSLVNWCKPFLDFHKEQPEG